MTLDATPRLALPFLAASQAQKHVTLNESLVRLDALVAAAVLSRTLATAPDEAEEGDQYLLPAGAAGEGWAGLAAGTLVRFDAGGWLALSCPAGTLAYVRDEGVLLLHDGSGWAPAGGRLGALQDLSRLGVGTAADAANPLAAKVNGALLTARRSGDGGDGDLRLTLEKQGVGDTASVLFQTGYSGRAELGLAGDDALSVKLSADGAAWRTVMRAEAAGPLTLSPEGGVVLAASEAPFATALTVEPSADAVSARACLQIGLWQWGQDPYGSGSPDFYVYNGPSNQLSLLLPIGGGMIFAGRFVFNAAGIGLAAPVAFAELPAADTAAGGRVFCADLPGGAGTLLSDGVRWRREGDAVAARTADAGFTLDALLDPPTQRVTGTLTANRTVTLSADHAWAGARFRVVRTGGGAGTLDVGGLRTLAAAGWCEVIYDGAAWRLSGWG